MSAAGILFIDDAGNILLVERSWNKELVLPGGVIESGESPRDAAAREIYEELGVVRTPGKLLVHDLRLGKDHYVFEGGLVPKHDEMKPDFNGEIAALHILSPNEAIQKHALAGRAQIAAALESLKSGGTSLLRDGD